MSNQPTHSAYIGLGSNLPEGYDILAKVLDKIERDGIVAVLETSPFYTTPPYGGIGPDYFNGVARVATPLSYDQLNHYFKSVEARFGRVRSSSPSRTVHADNPQSSATPAVSASEGSFPKLVPVDIDVVIFDSEITRPTDFSRSYFQLGYSRLTSLPLSPSILF